MLIPRGTIKDLYDNDECLLNKLKIHSDAIIALQKAVIQQQQEIEKLKAENEAVKRELRVQDMKEVLQYYEKTGTEMQKEAMQEHYNLGQSIEQHINNLKKENEQLKERIETIKRQSAAQGTKQVLKSCDITLML